MLLKIDFEFKTWPQGVAAGRNREPVGGLGADEVALCRLQPAAPGQQGGNPGVFPFWIAC